MIAIINIENARPANKLQCKYDGCEIKVTHAIIYMFDKTVEHLCAPHSEIEMNRFGTVDSWDNLTHSVARYDE